MLGTHLKPEWGSNKGACGGQTQNHGAATPYQQAQREDEVIGCHPLPLSVRTVRLSSVLYEIARHGGTVIRASTRKDLGSQ